MQFRQGDVLIEKVSELGKSIETTQETLLVRGEGRYHGHYILGNVDIYKNLNFDVENTTSHFIDVKELATLKHLNTQTKLPTKEHGDVPLKPGCYRVIRQREFNPYGKIIEFIKD